MPLLLACNYWETVKQDKGHGALFKKKKKDKNLQLDVHVGMSMTYVRLFGPLSWLLRTLNRVLVLKILIHCQCVMDSGLLSLCFYVCPSLQIQNIQLTKTRLQRVTEK